MYSQELNLLCYNNTTVKRVLSRYLHKTLEYILWLSKKQLWTVPLKFKIHLNVSRFFSTLLKLCVCVLRLLSVSRRTIILKNISISLILSYDNHVPISLFSYLIFFKSLYGCVFPVDYMVFPRWNYNIPFTLGKVIYPDPVDRWILFCTQNWR